MYCIPVFESLKMCVLATAAAWDAEKMNPNRKKDHMEQNPFNNNIEAISDVPCDEISSKTLSDQDVSEIIDDELEIPIIKEEVIENNVQDSEKISLESPPPLPPPGKHSSNIRGLCLLK